MVKGSGFMLVQRTPVEKKTTAVCNQDWNSIREDLAINFGALERHSSRSLYSK